MNKRWKNHWVCDPAFMGLEPIKVLYRQVDTDFVETPHRDDLKNLHTLFRKKVTIKEMPDRVFLDISADDFYKLYINGKYVTQGPAQSYPFYYYYNRVDVTDYLTEGENIVAVHVYYQGLIARAFNSGDYRQGMIAELIGVNGQDYDVKNPILSGRQYMDDTWKFTRTYEYGTSGIIGYRTQYLEYIDNRLKLDGWKELDFDDANWETAALKHDMDYQLVLQRTENVVLEERYPVEVRELKDGYFLDFGENLTGVFYMKAKGHAGAEVQILMGEELTEEGLVRSRMRCSTVYEDGLILAEGENELEQYDYKCFRYVQLRYVQPGSLARHMEAQNPNLEFPEQTGEVAEKPELYDFRVDFRHYPFDDSKVPCISDDALIQGIWRIGRNAVRLCTQEQFMDCPHREKGQYLGDLVTTGHAYSVLTGDTEYIRKVLIDFANSTRICKGMLAVAPGNLMQEIADSSLEYAYILLLYYHLSKDKELLKELLPVAEGVESYFDHFRNEAGLIENVKTKNNIVDWPKNLRDDYDFDINTITPGDGCHNVINALYYGTKLCIEKIKDILGIPYDNQTVALKQSFIDAFYKEETGLFVDSTISNHSAMHSNIYPLFFGMAPEGNKIADSYRERGFKCNVGLAYYVLYGLMRAGEKELAYEMIINKSEQSWYNMLKEGATTGFEAWGKDQKWNTSLCHGWAGNPIPVLLDMQKEDWDWMF